MYELTKREYNKMHSVKTKGIKRKSTEEELMSL